MSQINKTVIGCICRTFGEMDIDQESSLLVHGVNSISYLKLIVNLEAEFGIEIADEDIKIENFLTVANIVQVIKKYTD